MTTNPLVSIIIPAYNASKYLPQCLDSILAQTYKLWECIIIDDGSKDDTPSICDKYAIRDARVKVLHKKNEGVSIARNTGIEIASGEFITFIDADDWVETNYLNQLIDNSNYDIVFFPYTKIYINGEIVAYKLLEQEAYDENGFWNIVYYLKNNEHKINFYGFTWNKLFRTDIIIDNNVRFVEGLKISEDEVFTLNYCIYSKSIKVLPNPLYNYRILSNSLTRIKKTSSEQLLLARSLVHILEQNPNLLLLKNCFIPQIATAYCSAALMETSANNVKNILKESAIAISVADAKMILSNKYMYMLFTTPIIVRRFLIYIRKIKK